MTSEVIKGNIRSSLNFKIIFFCDIFFVYLTNDLLITFQECQHYENAIFFLKVIQGHIRTLLKKIILVPSFMYRF